jgi:hypothetical protein
LISGWQDLIAGWQESDRLLGKDRLQPAPRGS